MSMSTVTEALGLVTVWGAKRLLGRAGRTKPDRGVFAGRR